METVTQFASRILGIASPLGTGNRCWLCGGDCGDEARAQKDVIAPTFTQHNLAACEDSTVVCGGCEALTLASSWQGVVAARGMDIKVWTQAGWHSYSHFIAGPDVYECPKPSRVREILLSPPATKWLLGINESGKKHTVFRSAVNTGGQSWAVFAGDALVRTTTAEFATCLSAFEAMVAEGFSKASVVSGDYHPATMLKVGIAKARALDARVVPYRRMRPDLLGLVAYCAFGVAQFAEAAPEPAQPVKKSEVANYSADARGQMEMFL
ncbi:hypothetical protein APY04_0803 [Hyphomicrobium sulfonivorans]|uniref:Uncharacterized protein n=1 Tax=Hyphomicrobium sulfonivorans TaxID=121290 RepID=A0A109BMM1_HYPSL|nr:hypothetical protein [Hyphomicrobium sulfonivorans]KWT70742.1 hypothetical protein APY04_0803 [Hyphomicrobium sulfonivorans]